MPEEKSMKAYETWVKVEKGNKSIEWGYCINASCEVNAKLEALNRARCKAAEKNSRWKGAKITFYSIREAFSKDVLHTI